MTNSEWLTVLITVVVIMASASAFLMKILLDIKKEIQIISTCIVPIERIKCETHNMILEHSERCRSKRATDKA